MFLLKDAPGGICFVEACRIPLVDLNQGLTVEVASVRKILPND